MLVLGIESSCDETSVALVRDGKEILVNLIDSQILLHRKYAGVFPEYASRRHLEVLLPLIDKALSDADISPPEIDLIAVSYGPGLIGALVMGLNAAKSLSLAWNKPFIGINHIEGHLYAAIMSAETPPTFPALGVVVSGGHTALLCLENRGTYKLIGSTVDDAIGEAFDKTAALLNLPYPGGPEIEKMARNGDPHRFAFKAGNVKNYPFNFSFSGLKTNVLYTVKGPNAKKNDPLTISNDEIKDIAASFQHAACIDIVKKSFLAAKAYGCKSILFGGGVSNNRYLRNLMALHNEENYSLFWPGKNLCLDNAAMIAGLAYHRYQLQGAGHTLDLEAKPRIPFSEWGACSFTAHIDNEEPHCPLACQAK